MTTYLGLDLGWKTNPDSASTGACIIQGRKLIDFENLESDDDIISYAVEYDADYIGIDAPLVVPNELGSRLVEKELNKMGISVFSSNREFFQQFGGARGEILLREFEDYGFKLIENTRENSRGVLEVYPRATMLVLLEDLDNNRYKRVPKDEMRGSLEEIWNQVQERLPQSIDLGEYENFISGDKGKISKKELKRKGDLIDAFFSAYVLLLDDIDESTNISTIGDKQTGFIITAI